MELNKNLIDKEQKTYLYIAVGLVFIAVGSYYVLHKISKNTFDQFDWAYLAFYAIIGLKYLIQGLLLLMRKAYVIINDEKISLKPDSSTKGEMIFWKDIMTIKKSGKNFEILSTDSSAYTIHLSYYDYKTADEIEYTLTNIASEKGIIISGN